MKKPFLLIVGDVLYPRQGTEDWIGFFKTEKEALREADFQTGDLESTKYWFKIVDMREHIKNQKHLKLQEQTPISYF